MFLYWGRELTGWFLVLLGLCMLLLCFVDLLSGNPHIISAPVVTFIGVIIFRGGIHLLKVAVAAQAARALPETSAQPATRMASRMPTKTFGPTPVKSVVPGPKSRAAATANGEAD